MNQQRQQAYLNLIHSLLNCPNGEEAEILDANQELVDAGLLQVMETVIQVFSQRRSEKSANWANRLRNLSERISQALKIHQFPQTQGKTKNSDAYIRFLQQVLQAIKESRANAQVVYPLLVNNIDKLDEVLAEILRRWGTKTLGEVEADDAIHIATAISVFGNFIQQFPNGDKANNVEIAIASYKTVLKVFTRQALPELWASTQDHLGLAYTERIKGDKTNNIENAISYHNAALKVFTRKAFPQYWALTQMNLGVTYINQIKGDKADNVENAISYCNAALQVFTRQAFPQYWAQTQMNLGGAYTQIIKGDKTDNIENAIFYCNAALQVFTSQAFPQQWANTQNNLGLAYFYRIKEDKADNIEKAISCWHAALQVFTRQAFTQNWAQTQMNLGGAYTERVKEDKADNIEKAISCCNAALQVFTRQDFPQEWARTQDNLGNAYINRVKEDKAENIEKAIETLQASLQVRTREAFPHDWASTQHNLGNAYINRIKEDKADNIEKAIKAYKAVLQVRTREAFPQDWANTQNSLGLAYIHRIKGDKAENIEKAIETLQASLQVSTREAFPQDWAGTQNNLGFAYTERIKEDKADNIENAIKAYKAALEIHTREAYPQDWATTQQNLGGAYTERIKEDKADNIENAIKALRAALQIHSREAYPQDWASTQVNLGGAYWRRINGDKAENIENAIKAFQAALEVYTPEADPQKWAKTQNNLGLAYTDRIKGDKAENLENAIATFHAALQVAHTREALPFNWAMTQHNLGNAYARINEVKPREAHYIENAIEAYKAALQVRTREAFPEYWAMTQISLGGAYWSRRIKGDPAENVENAIKAYHAALEVYTHQAFPQQWAMTQSNLGAAYKDRTKGNQGENIKIERDSKTIFPPEVVTQLEKYRNEIATGQYRIQNGKAENPQVLAQHLNQLRQQRNELQNRYLSVGSDFKFDSFKATLDKRTAIIEWYLLNNKILAFIVTSKGEITVWQSQPEEQEALINWLDKYLQDYNNQKDKWKDSLEEELKTLASILHIDEILTLIPKDCNQLILIPHRFLHLLPFHALPVGENHQDSHCLLDLFTGGISYAPSCQLLQQVQKRERPNFESIFAIKNPTNDLAYTKLEVDNILNLFSSHQVLSDNQASKNALLREMSKLKEANYLHFSCHGSFNVNSPQDSCLLLAESKDENNDLYLNKCLTLENLFDQDFQLDNCRLVVLSACETGLVDFTNASDEYISLPSGFLYAGSSSVVSSLWTVNDLSTAFLMIKFLQNLQTAIIHGEDFSVAVSLSQAQKWLRNSTKTQLEDWIGEHKLNFDSTLRHQLRRRFHNIPNDSRPFESPFYWAAFCGVGL
jgi:CHAT domain-containing protein/signal recognition particle subunit SEC65